MNRRTLLRVGAGSLPFAFLSGCLSSLSLGTPVTVHIENETDVNRNVAITAFDTRDDRGTYDQSVNAPANQAASLGPLRNTSQYVRVELFYEDEDEDTIEVEETFIGERTRAFVVIITEDGLELEVDEREREPELEEAE